MSKKEKMAKSYEIKYAKEQKFNQTRDTGTTQTLGEGKKKSSTLIILKEMRFKL